MKPLWHLVLGLVLLPCAAIIGWDGLLESGSYVLIALLVLAMSALQFCRCVQARRAGYGWTERIGTR
jgi:hypothetical protein